MGIPVIGCSCEVCRSSSPYNKRMRSSGLLKIGEKRILIDAGPELRLQALKHEVNRLDGVIITHIHYDHIAGFDDLRVYSYLQKQPLSCALSEESLKEIQARYHYIAPNQFAFHLMHGDSGRIEFAGIPIDYCTYYQREVKVTGIRIGKFAYVSDIREYSSEVMQSLRGVETLIVSALRDTPSPVHFSVDEAVEFARAVGAKRTWLTHIAHEIDHEKTSRELPTDVQLGYDGLEIPI